jgi:hypothetical protein
MTALHARQETQVQVGPSGQCSRTFSLPQDAQWATSISGQSSFP